VNEPETVVWMGRLVELSRSDGALPDPALIWWKARLLDRQAAQARVTRPMAVAQWLSLVLTVVTMVVLCALNWSGIQGLFAPFGFAMWLIGACGLILMGFSLRFVLGD
jgi:hypothetical protein